MFNKPKRNQHTSLTQQADAHISNKQIVVSFAFCYFLKLTVRDRKFESLE